MAQLSDPRAGNPPRTTWNPVWEREIVRSRNEADPNTRILSFAEQSPWLERAGWEAMLKGRDRELLSAMIEMPRPQTGQPHVLFCGHADCPENSVVSTLEDERRIAAIMNLVDPMMDRCEQTARSTSRNILCWVRSVKPLSSSPEPFQLVRQPSTTKKYRYLHKRLLAFVLRTYRLDPVVRQRLTGIRLSTKYLRLLDSLWQNRYWNLNERLADNTCGSAVTCDLIDPSLRGAAVDVNDDAGEPGSNDENDDEYDDGSDDNGEGNSNEISNDNYEDDCDDDSDGSAYADSSGCEAVSVVSNRIEDDDARILPSHDTGAPQCADEVLELIFGLSVVLFEERPIDGRLESMMVVLFSSILGYSKSRRIFLPARDFTTHLSVL